MVKKKSMETGAEDLRPCVDQLCPRSSRIHWKESTLKLIRCLPSPQTGAPLLLDSELRLPWSASCTLLPASVLWPPACQWWEPGPVPTCSRKSSLRAAPLSGSAGGMPGCASPHKWFLPAFEKFDICITFWGQSFLFMKVSGALLDLSWKIPAIFYGYRLKLSYSTTMEWLFGTLLTWFSCGSALTLGWRKNIGKAAYLSLQRTSEFCGHISWMQIPGEQWEQLCVKSSFKPLVGDGDCPNLSGLQSEDQRGALSLSPHFQGTGSILSVRRADKKMKNFVLGNCAFSTALIDFLWVGVVPQPQVSPLNSKMLSGKVCCNL